jgi:hypothetical protein
MNEYDRAQGAVALGGGRRKLKVKGKLFFSLIKRDRYNKDKISLKIMIEL